MPIIEQYDEEAEYIDHARRREELYNKLLDYCRDKGIKLSEQHALLIVEVMEEFKDA